jgi:hypothetical protein
MASSLGRMNVVIQLSQEDLAHSQPQIKTRDLELLITALSLSSLFKAVNHQDYAIAHLERRSIRTLGCSATISLTRQLLNSNQFHTNP